MNVNSTHKKLIFTKGINDLIFKHSLLNFCRASIFAENKPLNNIFLQQLLHQILETSLIEWLAVLFGIAQVWLAWKNNTMNFYAGIISVCLFTYVFYSIELYAESLLNLYYFVVSIAGIFLWREGNKLPVTFTYRTDGWKAFSIALISWMILYGVLRTFTKSNVPFLDALVTSLAWAGTWLMIKRKVENWIVLNLSNVIAIPLQFYKGLELTALLTLIYVVIAIIGYLEWRKIALSNEVPE